MADNMLHTDNLLIGYKKEQPLYETGKLVLKQNTLTVIAGRNGCGKSTLLHTLAGLHKPLSGKVYYHGSAIDQIPVKKRSRLFSMVLTGRIRNQYLRVQDLLLLTIQANEGFFASRQKNAIQKSKETALLCKIENLLTKSINHLSDGEYQRVMIARALVQDTPLLLLDEPVAHLDPVAQRKTFDLLSELVKNGNKTILAATHAFNLAHHYADEFWLIDLNNQFKVAQRNNVDSSDWMQKLYGE